MRKYQANVNVYFVHNGQDMVADCDVTHYPGNYHSKPEDCYPEETEVIITEIKTSDGVVIWTEGGDTKFPLSDKETESLEDKAAQLAFMKFEIIDMSCEHEW